MKRRRFLRIVSLGGLAVLAGLGRWAGGAGPGRVVRAVPGRAFPGRVVRPDPDAMRRPGTWSG